MVRHDILVPTIKAAAMQANPTEDLMEIVNRIFGYLKCKSNLGLRFGESDHNVQAESDASYNSESKARCGQEDTSTTAGEITHYL